MSKGQNSEVRWWTRDPNQPSTFDDIWQEALPLLYSQWSIEHKNLLTKACVSYLLRITNFVQMSHLLREGKVPGTLNDWRELRLHLVKDFRTVLGLKLTILRCKARELNRRKPRLGKEIKLNHLHPNDKAVYKSLALMGLETAIEDKLYKLPGQGIPSARMVTRQCAQALQESASFIDKYVGRKHPFIYKGNNLQHHDIANELRLKAIETFYHVTPFLTELHRAATIKRAAHNHGCKIIQYYTDPVRARQRKVNGKFENTIQTFSTEAADPDDPNEDGNDKAPKLGFRQPDSHNRVALRNYIAQHHDAVKIISLLNMRDNNEFIRYVEQATENSFSSAEEMFETFGSEYYYQMIANFLQINTEEVIRVVLDLQNVLSR